MDVDISHIQVTIFMMLTNDVKGYINMFGASMKFWIANKLNARLVVAVQASRLSMRKSKIVE